MGHCKPDELKDIEPVLGEIRKLELLKEKKTGTFYFKSKGFLHFHSKDGKRWADVRNGIDWGEPIDLPFDPSATLVKKFMKSVKAYYKATTLA